MTIEIELPYPRRQRSPEVSEEMAAIIKALLAHGMTQHDIAARFGINQGRVSEINKGKRHPGILPAQL
ncbi:sigma factor-like helix-turn-helix DNA-binding protein [Pseudaminobacter sp. NGMCC 1.201702]|uniref:sigma factor-like helix-turn-helix DNA-binding protein n=1 Tax=Pseudaminobacter sp. NGMCC 1.201702 TaxID=3391825 RepID=UPI0039EF83F5